MDFDEKKNEILRFLSDIHYYNKTKITLTL